MPSILVNLIYIFNYADIKTPQTIKWGRGRVPQTELVFGPLPGCPHHSALHHAPFTNPVPRISFHPRTTSVNNVARALRLRVWQLSLSNLRPLVPGLKTARINEINWVRLSISDSISWPTAGLSRSRNRYWQLPPRLPESSRPIDAPLAGFEQYIEFISSIFSRPFAWVGLQCTRERAHVRVSATSFLQIFRNPGVSTVIIKFTFTLPLSPPPVPGGKDPPRKDSFYQSAADGFQIFEAAFIREHKNISLRCAPPNCGTWAKRVSGIRGVEWI